MSPPTQPTIVSRLQEFSIPLIVGVLAALLFANADDALYHRVIHAPFLGWGTATAATEAGHGEVEPAAGFDWRHFCTLHFVVNDLFMVLFFGLATKEITESCLPGGALNPIHKAINPLLGTIGGVLGPIAVYLSLNSAFGDPAWTRGWGIPTATDIALAWLIARSVFGKGHPAISFLLLLAVADDGIGLGIIAFAYPDPHHPTEWGYAIGLLPAMACCWFLRNTGVKAWWPYLAFGGTIAWISLFRAHLHPALSLVFVVPFLPGPRRDYGMFEDREPLEAGEYSTLEKFEHDVKLTVDFGLFFFAFANAGVSFAEVTPLTWIVFASLLAGKTLGITLFSAVGSWLGVGLPRGMTHRDLFVAGIIAGTGLTVALFVAGQAFSASDTQGAAKMGALFSAFAAVVAFVAARLLGISPASVSATSGGTTESPPSPEILASLPSASSSE